MNPPRIVHLLNLAREWHAKLDRGELRTRAERAKLSGRSGDRVSCILALLKLHPAIMSTSTGFPGTPERDLTERWLRPITRLPQGQQLRMVLPRLEAIARSQIRELRAALAAHEEQVEREESHRLGSVGELGRRADKLEKTPARTRQRVLRPPPRACAPPVVHASRGRNRAVTRADCARLRSACLNGQSGTRATQRNAFRYSRYWGVAGWRAPERPP